MKRSVAALILLAWCALGFFVACSDAPGPQARAPVARIEAVAATPEPAKPEAVAPKPEAVLPKPEMAPKPEPKAEATSEIAALILASEETILSSQMAGRIRKVNVGLGDEVKTGAPLIEF